MDESSLRIIQALAARNAVLDAHLHDLGVLMAALMLRYGEQAVFLTGQELDSIRHLVTMSPTPDGVAVSLRLIDEP